MNEVSKDRGVGRRITRYGMFLTLSGIVCKIMLLVYTVYAVEILGKEQFGRLEYLFEIAIIFSVLVDFGLEQTVTRELARRQGGLFHSLYPLILYRITASIAGAVVMLGFLALVRRPEQGWSLVGAAAVYFFIVLNVMLIRAAVRSREWLAVESWANVIDKIFHIGLAMTCLFLYPSLPLLLLCYSAGALASLLIFLFVLLKEYGWKPRSYSISEWFDWQRMAVPIGLSAACILLLHREDTVMVNWIRGDEETGLYRAPYRFLEGLFLFPQVLAISAYPVFSKLYHDNKAFAGTASLLLRGLILLSLPIAAGGTVVAHDLMQWLTPELGKAGGDVFAVLLWSLPFIYANFLLGTVLNAVDRQRMNFYASAWGLLSNALLNIPAIYFLGAIGASIMTAVSQGLYGVLMIIYLRDYQLFRDWKRYSAIIVAVGLMTGILRVLNLQWYLSIPVGAVSYAVFVVVLRGITYEEVMNVKRVIRGD